MGRPGSRASEASQASAVEAVVVRPDEMPQRPQAFAQAEPAIVDESASHWSFDEDEFRDMVRRINNRVNVLPDAWVDRLDDAYRPIACIMCCWGSVAGMCALTFASLGLLIALALASSLSALFLQKKLEKVDNPDLAEVDIGESTVETLRLFGIGVGVALGIFLAALLLGGPVLVAGCNKRRRRGPSCSKCLGGLVLVSAVPASLLLAAFVVAGEAGVPFRDVIVAILITIATNILGGILKSNKEDKQDDCGDGCTEEVKNDIEEAIVEAIEAYAEEVAANKAASDREQRQPADSVAASGGESSLGEDRSPADREPGAAFGKAKEKIVARAKARKAACVRHSEDCPNHPSNSPKAGDGKAPAEPVECECAEKNKDHGHGLWGLIVTVGCNLLAAFAVLRVSHFEDQTGFGLGAALIFGAWGQPAAVALFPAIFPGLFL